MEAESQQAQGLLKHTIGSESIYALNLVIFATAFSGAMSSFQHPWLLFMHSLTASISLCSLLFFLIMPHAETLRWIAWEYATLALESILVVGTLAIAQAISHEAHGARPYQELYGLHLIPISMMVILLLCWGFLMLKYVKNPTSTGQTGSRTTTRTPTNTDDTPISPS